MLSIRESVSSVFLRSPFMSDILSPKHFEAFGRIIYACSEMDRAIKLCLGATYSLRVHDIFLITEPYSASNLKKVAKSAAKLYFSNEMKNDFVAILGKFGKFSTLRNHIAHNHWTEGSRPKSVRIVQADIRAGRLDLKGYSEDEPDYTLDELGDAANDLFDLHTELIAFMRDYGLSAAMAKKMREQSTDSASSLGDISTASSSSPDETHS